MSSSTTDEDLLRIPYDAPLSVKQPSYLFWITPRAFQGINASTLTIPDVDCSGKWVIISGSNRGIGRDVALRFASWGANLILACRNQPPKEIHPTVVVKECQEHMKRNGKSAEVEWWEVDMAELASIEAFTARWLQTNRALDILCNNAGLGSSPGGETVMKTRDGFEIIHQVH
jgi:NAD(P)-dependent dehydrogenase (short-subunit alcohol dehydrogenase family)